MDEQIELILRGSQFKKLLDERAVALRKKYDMKKAEVEIVYFLSRSGEHNTSKDIHNHLMMNKGHISQVVESLCQRNYLVAIPDKEDRRYIHYELTEEAKCVVDEIVNIRATITDAILQGVTKEELKTFRSVTRKISCNIEKLL